MAPMPATDAPVLVVDDNAFTRTTLCGALRDASSRDDDCRQWII